MPPTSSCPDFSTDPTGDNMTLVDLDGLLACLEFEDLGDGRWTAPHLQLDYRRIFGGQLLAQAVVLADASAPEKAVRSLSCVFPREGSLDEPLEYRVEAVHDGRSFATRRITGAQGDRVCLVAQASLHVAEEGPEHGDPPPDVGLPGDAEPTDLSMVPWPCRVVDGVDLGDRGVGPAEFRFWTRVDRELPDDPAVHQALLAHATDLTVIGTALRPHEGLSQADSTVRLATAVTAHQIVFHRAFRLDDWCLVDQCSPVAAGARAFGVGNVFDADGRLVASFTQESMVRPIVPDEDHERREDTP